MKQEMVVAVLAPGKSRKVSFKVTIAASGGTGTTIADAIFGPGAYRVGSGVMIGSPAGAKWAGRARMPPRRRSRSPRPAAEYAPAAARRRSQPAAAAR
jgi:hypothetical protein